MRKAEREKYILEILTQKDFIDVAEIERHCGVSAITARRDLDGLAKKGLLNRTHGGAQKKKSNYPLFHFAGKTDQNAQKKEVISRFAARFIEDNDAVLLDSGTTVYRLCAYISDRKNLQIITSSLPAAAQLMGSEDIKVFLIGGEIFPDRQATYGPIASEHISQIHVKKAFIGTDGISLQRGLTVRDVNEATRIKAMIDAADKVYLLCDSSKIESNSLFKLAPLSSVDYLITDKDISKKIAEQYEKNGIKVLIAE